MNQIADQPLPVIEVIRGNPTPDEVAALVVVLLARLSATSAAGPTPTPNPVVGWARRRGLPTVPRPGPDAWRFSARSC